MTTAQTLRQQINDLLDTLSLDDQRRVLHFMQSLHGLPPSITGKELVELINRAPPEAIEAAKEVAEILQREHEIESRLLARWDEVAAEVDAEAREKSAGR